MNLYEGLGLALAVIGAVAGATALIAILGIWIDRLAAREDGAKDR